MVFSPERQTLLMVVAGTLMGIAAVDGGLAGGDLTLARLEDLTHQHGVDRGGVEARLGEEGGDGHAAEFARSQGRQGAGQFADRSAKSGDDHTACHFSPRYGLLARQ